MRTRNLFFAALMSAIVPACGTPAGVDSANLAGDGKNDSLASTASYYTVREDSRGSPRLEGLWVRRLNRATTRCADGKDAPECYVATENYDQLNLSAHQHADLLDAMARGEVVVRATIKANLLGELGIFGELVVTEVWQAQNRQVATGTFYRVKDSGVRCITTPCPSYRRETLNSTVSETIADVDFSSIGGEDAIDKAFEQLFSAQGVLVAGADMEVTGPAGAMKGLKASVSYLRLVGEVGSCRADSDCPQPLCITDPCPSFECIQGRCEQGK